MRARLRLVLGISIPILVVLLLLAAWAIDTSKASGKVPRNVTLAGRDIGRLGEDDLAATVADIADQYATTTVRVRTQDQTYAAAASKLGLRLDEKATARAALHLDRDRSLVARPLVWLGSFLDERKASLVFTVDPSVLEMGLHALGGDQQPTEPSIVPTATGFGIVSGSAGLRIDAKGVRQQLLARARSGELPIVVNAEAVEQRPTVSDADAQALADQLTMATGKGLEVTAGDQHATIGAATVRSWLGAQVKGGKISPTLDAEAATKDLAAALPGTTEAADARFTVENGAVKLTPSVDGTRCCAADTAARLLAAITAGKGSVEIGLEVSKPKFTTEDATKLGIKEPVGTTTEWKGIAQVKSFTTYYDPGAPRVTNIHRIADLIRGTLVKPGQRFSVNDTVGERTIEKGFVEAGAIANGEHVEQVGGGVSQFATTMFNAAFFAGLKINTYQAHSEHFDRYPFGREATMGYPNPDLAWTNDTPYGILIWTSYTDTSVTVTLYSTQYAYGEQTGQSTGRSGSCTTVTTQRTIHYQDGRTATDEFHARYRDPGKTSC
jgi:vancomycin resistance protein YoaR